MSRFEQYDGGKGPEDRSNSIKRAASPLWKQVKLQGGISLTPEEASKAIQNAMYILSVKDNMVDADAYIKAKEWMNTYFPNIK